MILEGFETQIAKLNKLKVTYTGLINEEEDFFAKLKVRAEHLKNVQTHKTDFDDYFKQKLNRILLDFMLR